MADNSLKSKFTLPWQGLYMAMVSHSNQVQKMETWLQKLKHCRHRSRASWEDLMECLAGEEPFQKTSKSLTAPLVFKPVFYHLAPISQNVLLTVIYQHREEISRKTLETLVDLLSAACQTTAGTHERSKPDEKCSNHSKPAEKSGGNSRTEVESGHQSDWLHFWQIKFQRYIDKGALVDLDEKNKRTDTMKYGAYRFAVESQEQLDEIFSHINETSARQPWNTTLWVAPVSQESHTQSSMMSGHDIDMDMSVCHQSQEGDIADSAQTIQSSAGKRMKLEESLVDIGLSESRLEAALGENIMGCGQRMKEAWHRNPADHVAPCDLTLLADCAQNQLETLVLYLDLTGLSEANLTVVATQLTSQKERLSLTHATQLARACLLGKLQSLSASSSRALNQAFTSLSQAFPSAVIESVLVPVLTDPDIGLHQTDLIVRLLKETLNPEHQEAIVRGFLSPGTSLTVSTVPVLQAVVDAKARLGNSTLDLLTSALVQSSTLMADNLKFGKLVLGTAKAYDNQLCSAHVSNLLQASEAHRTFLKKSINTALRKIKIQ